MYHGCHDLTRLPGLWPLHFLERLGELGIEGVLHGDSELAVKELRQDGSLDWITGCRADVPREINAWELDRVIRHLQFTAVKALVVNYEIASFYQHKS